MSNIYSFFSFENSVQTAQSTIWWMLDVNCKDLGGNPCGTTNEPQISSILAHVASSNNSKIGSKQQLLSTI